MTTIQTAVPLTPRLGRIAVLVAVILVPAIGSAQSHAFVDIGGRRLDVVHTGSGGPAVVFEVGLADSLDTWLPVSTAIAKVTTSIATPEPASGAPIGAPTGTLLGTP